MKKKTTIILSQKNVKMKIGESGHYVSVKVRPIVCNKKIKWYTNEKSVITVDESSGYIFAHGEGTAKVYVELEGTNKKDYFTVNVTDPQIKVRLILLDKPSVTLKVGEKEQLTAIIIPDEATYKSYCWKSSDYSVAAVTVSGGVTAIKKGSAIITASALDGSGKNATCKVTVI